MKAYVLLGCMSGVGRLEICNLDPETHITYLCQHLYYEPLAIGDVQGFFEAFFGDSVAKGMELADDGYVIACARAERTTGLEERLEYVPRKKIPGSVRFDRCRKCGVVLEAANCEWDWRDGVVINHLNGLHEMVVPTSGVEALCRELTAELGEEITGMLIDIERSYTIKRIEEYGMRASLSGLSESKESSAENMEIFLSDLPLRGMGNPIGFSLDDDILRVRVNNPFNEALICGKVLGYYEALEGKKGRLQWEVPEGEWAVELEIHPD